MHSYEHIRNAIGSSVIQACACIHIDMTRDRYTWEMLVSELSLWYTDMLQMFSNTKRSITAYSTDPTPNTLITTIING